MKTTDLEISVNLINALDSSDYQYFTYFNHASPNHNTSTFTMCELWDMLPDYIEFSKFYYKKCLWNVYDEASACFIKRTSVRITENNTEFLVYYTDENPCNALAKLVIWCLENNHKLNL